MPDVADDPIAAARRRLTIQAARDRIAGAAETVDAPKPKNWWGDGPEPAPLYRATTPGIGEGGSSSGLEGATIGTPEGEDLRTKTIADARRRVEDEYARTHATIGPADKTAMENYRAGLDTEREKYRDKSIGESAVETGKALGSVAVGAIDRGVGTLQSGAHGLAHAIGLSPTDRNAADERPLSSALRSIDEPLDAGRRRVDEWRAKESEKSGAFKWADETLRPIAETGASLYAQIATGKALGAGGGNPAFLAGTFATNIGNDPIGKVKKAAIFVGFQKMFGAQLGASFPNLPAMAESATSMYLATMADAAVHGEPIDHKNAIATVAAFTLAGAKGSPREGHAEAPGATETAPKVEPAPEVARPTEAVAGEPRPIRGDVGAVGAQPSKPAGEGAFRDALDAFRQRMFQRHVRAAPEAAEEGIHATDAYGYGKFQTKLQADREAAILEKHGVPEEVWSGVLDTRGARHSKEVEIDRARKSVENREAAQSEAEQTMRDAADAAAAEVNAKVGEADRDARHNQYVAAAEQAARERVAREAVDASALEKSQREQAALDAHKMRVMEARANAGESLDSPVSDVNAKKAADVRHAESMADRAKIKAAYDAEEIRRAGEDTVGASKKNLDEIVAKENAAHDERVNDLSEGNESARLKGGEKAAYDDAVKESEAKRDAAIAKAKAAHDRTARVAEVEARQAKAKLKRVEYATDKAEAVARTKAENRKSVTVRDDLADKQRQSLEILAADRADAASDHERMKRAAEREVNRAKTATLHEDYRAERKVAVTTERAKASADKERRRKEHTSAYVRDPETGERTRVRRPMKEILSDVQRHEREAFDHYEAAARVKPDAVGKPGSPFKTEADYLAALTHPGVQEAIKSRGDYINSRTTPDYVAATGGDPSKMYPVDPILGFHNSMNPVNEKGFAESRSKTLRTEEGIVAGGGTKEARRAGQKSGPFVNAPRTAQHRTGSSHAYETDFRENLGNQITAARESASKMRYAQKMVEAGKGSFKEGEIPDAVRIPFRRYGTEDASLYVHPDLATEAKKIFNADWKTEDLGTKVGQAFTKFNVFANPLETLNHIKNQFKAVVFSRTDAGLPTYVERLVQTGAFPLAAAYKLGKAMKAITRPSAERIDRLSQLGGVLRTGHGDATIQNAGGEALVKVHNGIAVYLDAVYDGMVESGAAKDTPDARRTFINERIGNYFGPSLAKGVQFLRNSGISPFIVAKTTQANMGIKAFTTVDGLAGVAGLAISTYILNRILTGDDPPKDAPIGTVAWRDKDGKTKFVDVANFTPARRGLRSTGADALIEGRRRGLTWDESIGDALTGAGRTLEDTLASGPMIQFAQSTATGEDFAGNPTHEKNPRHTPAQTYALNAIYALADMNPVAGEVVHGVEKDGKSGDSLTRLNPVSTGKGEKLVENTPAIRLKQQLKAWRDDDFMRVVRSAPEDREKVRAEIAKSWVYRKKQIADMKEAAK